MKDLKECLVCGNKDLKIHCELGQQPLVNNLKGSPEEKEHIYPLVVMECPVCTHKQLSVAVDRELLFKDYLYRTGTSDKHKDFFQSFAIGVGGKGIILDIGANDGSLLVPFRFLLGYEVLGIDPCPCSANWQIPIKKGFFPETTIDIKFDVITAFNVFAHNDDPYTFLMEMAKLLKENGRIYILTTPARLDNFYHEHISYFNIRSMSVLASRCGLEIFSFKKVSMHGESYLFEIGHGRGVARLGEALLGSVGLGTAWQGWYDKRENIVAYGASASETVLFNYYKIVPEYIVDDNVLKQGKFMPGVNSPIVNSEHLVKDTRDLTIICAHHLFEEISAKIKKLRPNHKDRFERLI